ncbi:cytochrome c5 family protein [Tropicibacter sp. R15_0]|uniref:c-type cytochrome n=1 Tax=Tropicibacter sp. R15_0 TaxID=2821101 RepID=UPI001AD9E3B7|nr:c-type cytochrome [Tropicibacter sp. R15_0]MBO9463698.1 cytochrome c5 family protein [Tropicibacter sp. R15_0]
MTRRLVIAGLLSASGVLAAGAAQSEPTLEGVLSAKGLSGFVTLDRLPMPDHPVLQTGRLVWEDTCMGCHGGNKATGAPKITATKKWQPRIAKGLPTLIDHATNGFVGKTYAEMPPRGANPDLSDSDVAAAVTFMVWASGGADQVLGFLAKKE